MKKRINVLFVCHGNICRSPMAEFVAKHIAKSEGISNDVFIDSAATSREEIGEDMHPSAKRILNEKGIAFRRRSARQIESEDFQRFDYVIVMEEYNIKNLKRVVGEENAKNCTLLYSYAGESRDISDPYYSGNFERTYEDILEGVKGLVAKIKEEL